MNLSWDYFDPAPSLLDYVAATVNAQNEALERACEHAVVVGVGVRCWRWFEDDRACFAVEPDASVPAGEIYEHDHAPPP